MIDLKNLNDNYTAWVTWPGDKKEKYQIKYLPPHLNNPTNQNYTENILSRILNWQGIFEGKTPLECNDENKQRLFNEGGVEAYERMTFLLIKMASADTFLNKESMLKNLKTA